jgi:hypothetical protein
VGGVVDLDKALCLNCRVALRPRQADMAKQFLYAAQIAPAREEVRREAVSPMSLET